MLRLLVVASPVPSGQSTTRLSLSRLIGIR